MTHPTVIGLHDGNLIPQLGLGVWKAGNEEVVSAIHKALEVGCCSFNTAAAYQNEAGVGNALHSAGINRDESFITTKLRSDDQKQPYEALKESLSRLKLNYVDLCPIHWSVPVIGHYVETWQTLIELRQQGLTKSTGVCNFQVPYLQKLIDETGVTPVISQVELHSLLQQRQLHAWNAIHKTRTESWDPLAQGDKGVFDQKVIHQLVDKCGKTLAQIVIRWHPDSGLVMIPKSVTPSRIAENSNVQDFHPGEDELSKITKSDQGKRLGPGPDQFDD